MNKAKHPLPKTLRHVEKLIEQRKFEKALTVAEENMRKNPGNVESFVGLALSLGWNNRQDQAVEVIREAKEKFPHNVMVRANSGFLLLQQGRYDDAEREYRTALEEAKTLPNPDAPEIRLWRSESYNGLGVISMERGQEDQARDLWRQALKIDPENRHVQMNLDEEEEEENEFTIDADEIPGSSFASMDDLSLYTNIQMDKYFSRSKREKFSSGEEMERVMRAILYDWNLHFLSRRNELGLMTPQQKTAMFESFTADFDANHDTVIPPETIERLEQKALSMSGEDGAEKFKEMAWAVKAKQLNDLIERDHYDRAKIVAEELIASHPDNSYAYVCLAISLGRTGQLRRALELLRSAKERFPTELQILFNYAQFRFDLFEYDEAEKLFFEALQIPFNDVMDSPADYHSFRSNGLTSLSIFFWMRGRLDDAIRFARLAYDENPYNIEARKHLAIYIASDGAADQDDEFERFMWIQSRKYLNAQDSLRFLTTKEEERVMKTLEKYWNSHFNNPKSEIWTMPVEERLKLYQSLKVV